jgi:hypothetical protein
MHAGLRRREFLASASLGVLALSACATAPTGDVADASTRRALQRMARRLYPHDAIGDEVYAEVVDGVIAGADETTRSQLADGAVALSADPMWRRGGAGGEVAAMQRLEDEPFFAVMRAGVQARLYDHPAMWAHLGYRGPALPFGGYWDKGFDDIAWLPPEGEDA